MIEHDKFAATDRVAATLTRAFYGTCEHVYEEISAHCSSPIEAMLGTAMFVGNSLCDITIDAPWESLTFCTQDRMDQYPKNSLLIPQYQWKTHRIDWVIREPDLHPDLIFIECDGHDFHNVTKAQAQKDRERDRIIQAAGIPIIRFTGSEIYKDPSACAIQVLDFITARIRNATRPQP